MGEGTPISHWLQLRIGVLGTAQWGTGVTAPILYTHTLSHLEEV